MDEHQHERRHHFRSKARPGRIMPVRFRAKDHTGWVSASTRDIGVGGAFVLTQLVQPAGTELILELTLPTTDQTFTLPAVVKWATPGPEGGMGVQFVGVDIDVLLELNEYFSTVTPIP
jgi:Tfp pilus assembly protein PilZ